MILDGNNPWNLSQLYRYPELTFLCFALAVLAEKGCFSYSNMEVKKFKELYPETTIASPIDCQNLLTSGTTEEVAEACWKLIEDTNDERVLLGSTSEIHPAVPIENAVTMYDILRNYKDM